MAEYEPEQVWKYFEEIASVPHGSRNTGQISDYLVRFAEDHGFEHYQDASNNVIIIKEPSPGWENKEPVILQGHMDMVCEKTPDNPIDMTKEGLSLYTEDGFLKARGTTLGGDDGIAIAIGMALLADDELLHPRLELVCTVDEEIGLLGAAALDVSPLRGKILINIDSEEEGIFTVGCAGGMTLNGRLSLPMESCEGVVYTLAVSGILGGHSGSDIHRMRINPNLAAARVMSELAEEFPVRIIGFAGGGKENVIPNRTEAEFVLITAEPASEGEERDIAGQLKRKCSELEEQFRNEYAGSDAGICITVAKKAGPAADSRLSAAEDGKALGIQHSALTEEAQEQFLDLLINLPDGVQKMSGEVDGLVETSLNLGVCTLKDGILATSQSLRSSKRSAKAWLSKRVIRYLESFGVLCEIEGDYPGWEFKADSPLRERFTEAYQTLFGREPLISVIHAGLECGLFSEKIPGLDSISVGPDILDIHTVSERLDIASSKRTYDLVRYVIEHL